MSLEEELTQLNIAIGEAEKRRDDAALKCILANDLIFRRASGVVVDKATYLEELLKPENTYSYLCSEIVDIKLSELQNIAIVTLHVYAKGKRGKNLFEGVYRNIRFFQKGEQGWQCHAWFNEPLEYSPMEEERKRREYGSSLLPVLPSNAQIPENKEILLSLYGEICNNFRMLTDVRFKLLGLVPTVSVAVLISLLSQKPDEKLSSLSQIGISIFGLLITFGIAIYEQRNSELYKDLVLRGNQIEKELGIDTGQFRGRIKPSNAWIDHKCSINIIYGTATVGWLFAMVSAICKSLGLTP